jgi:hypothetical protein
VEVGAGDRVVNWAIIQTYDMLGKFSNLPDDLKQSPYQ